MTESNITPPPELMEHWLGDMWPQDALLAAAQWGADQELEACCEWIAKQGQPFTASDLRATRRPKPPSLKQQALTALAAIEGDFNTVGDRADTIRRALEALPDA